MFDEITIHDGLGSSIFQKLKKGVGLKTGANSKIEKMSLLIPISMVLGNQN